MKKQKTPKEDDSVGKLLLMSFVFSSLIIIIIGMILKIGQ